MNAVPRNALVWMIITQFALVAPHFQRIPLWVFIVFILAAVWRLQVFRGRWSFPGRGVKIALVVSSFVGIYLSFGTWVGLEPTVALLLTASAFKLVELVNRKDGYVLLFLAYFVCLTEFLFSQDLPVVLYSMVTVVLATTSLIALHRPGEDRFDRSTIRLAMVMLMQCIPLMLVMFFLFPRLGPLWAVPIKSQAAKTGVSDFMKPGDISNLSQSAEVAFRVQFDGEVPPQSELYWRGLVFSRLDEGTWSSLKYYDVPLKERRPQRSTPPGDAVSYSVILEPTQQNWLYSLRYAEALDAKVMSTHDFRLFSPIEVEDEYQYRAMSWPQHPIEMELSPWRRATELAVAPDDNPRTQVLAREIRAQNPGDREFVNAVLTLFNEEQFIYTLQPPALGEQAMDDFLFLSRRGFCEHFSSAFVLMMRAAGVPARVVAGYQGGEVNPLNGTVIVHQFDAHAWAEVWLPGEGWVRVDPTAAVSPDRIEMGLEQAMAGEGSFLSNSPLSPLRYRSVAWLNRLRLQYDALTWRWQKWVVAYNAESQFAFLQDVLGEFTARKFAAIMLGSGLLVLVPVAISLFARRTGPRLSKADKLFLAFCSRLEKWGVSRGPGEAAASFARRVADEYPQIATQALGVGAAYDQLAYADDTKPGQRRIELERELAAAVRALRFRRS